MLNLLRSIASKPRSLLDKFKYMDEINDDLCVKVTGWTVKQFLRFADYIHSTNINTQRNKYQLIALYRLWIRKGLSQEVISFLKEDSNQRSISRCLNQIREAIFKDFTHIFLGPKSKSREFFISQNTEIAKELLDLKNDELVIVADGTYTRIEKSADSEFQYNTYSSQKSDSLVKPFLITCASGYIIDCYCPYKANQNDAYILDDILKNNSDIRDLLIRDKTIIALDRGEYEFYLDTMLIVYKLLSYK